MFAEEKYFHGFALTLGKDKYQKYRIFTPTHRREIVQFLSQASFIILQCNTERKRATEWLYV